MSHRSSGPIDPLDHPTRGMTRRQFGRWVALLGAAGCLEPHFVVRALGADSPRRLSWLAYRTAGAEGLWELRDVEGEVPKDLHGTLYRVAPGQSENHGVTLRHLFDGDAFVSGFSIRDGKVTLRARFVPLPERLEELEAGRMLYSEFGTLAPPAEDGAARTALMRSKNQPSVNVIPWDGRLLGLSEGGHPTAIDPLDFSFQGRWDFHGTLPPNVPFTAHPKWDPTTGEAYGYGVAQGPSLALTVFRMEPDGRLTQLHAVPLGGYFMIHDMLLTERHLVFVVPPVQFDLVALFSGKLSVAEAIRYGADQPTRLILVRRDGGGEPTIVEQPANMVFHHGNAFERDGQVVIDSILSPDSGVLELLRAFADERLPEVPPPRLTRLEVDLASRAVVSRAELAESQEFPRFDNRRIGRPARRLLTMEAGLDDQLAATCLVRHDLERGEAQKVEAGEGRALGETVFVAREGEESEDNGWLLLQGYDAKRDENFLEIRDAGTLDLQARVWTGQHFPLGFHGNFVRDRFVVA
jgi:all-trans-8'-apo-beta-carotenal 15,15'-oxygenase